GAVPAPAAVPPPPRPAEPAPSVAWTSAGDEGWRAAEAVRQPSVGGLTRAGLPIRVPMTHLVSGAAGPSGEHREPVPSDHLAPEKVRGRLSSYYQGVTRGREEGGQTSAGAPFGEEER
ncbi:MAG TPA: hypothetical protein VKP11_09065, partial [Frankiaceae bacterium]|nr:hypothetical protein [Frankiaceae bacterium]